VIEYPSAVSASSVSASSCRLLELLNTPTLSLSSITIFWALFLFFHRPVGLNWCRLFFEKIQKIKILKAFGSKIHC
jgi:hypothetical protein